MTDHRPDLLFVFIQMKNFGFDIFPYFIILAAICLADIAPVPAHYDAACSTEIRNTGKLRLFRYASTGKLRPAPMGIAQL